jgi:hypothetical protein
MRGTRGSAEERAIRAVDEWLQSQKTAGGRPQPRF